MTSPPPCDGSAARPSRRAPATRTSSPSSCSALSPPAATTPASDADVLVLLRHDSRRVLDRIPDYSRAFEGLGLAVQVFPWTAAELTRRLAEHDRFAREILDTGITVAGTIPL